MLELPKQFHYGRDIILFPESSHLIQENKDNLKIALQQLLKRFIFSGKLVAKCCISLFLVTIMKYLGQDGFYKEVLFSS